MAIHNIGEKIIKQDGVHHDELLEWISNEDEINNFVGCFELDSNISEQEVPDTFPNNKLPNMITEEYTETIIDPETEEETIITKTREVVETDDEGEVVYRIKKWNEYAIIRESVNNGKVLLVLGERNYPLMNRQDTVKSEEFYLWVNHFGTDNIKTKSEYISLIKRDKEGQ